MKSAILLSARNSSTRLPGKALLPLAGAPMTQRLMDRLSLAETPDLCVLATSAHPDDAPLVNIAHAQGWTVFLGDPDDKLRRYLDAARYFDLDYVVVVDGDDPLCDPGYIDSILTETIRSGCAYGAVQNLPMGITAHAVQVEALDYVVEHRDGYSEIWPGYFLERFRCCLPPCRIEHAAPWLRMTLDYPADYAFFQAVFDELYRPGQVFSLDDVFDLLSRNPSIAAINQELVTTYAKNVKRKTDIRWKDSHDRAGCGPGQHGQAPHSLLTAVGRH